MRHAASTTCRLMWLGGPPQTGKKTDVSTRHWRRRQTLYNRIRLEFAQRTRAHDEHFGHNRRIARYMRGRGRAEPAGRASAFARISRSAWEHHDWRRSGRKAELAVRRELRARVRGTRSGPPQ